MAAPSLSSEQTTALFNLLSHYETYTEIESFKSPQTICSYGPPFQTERDVKSSSPLLQRLLTKLVLPLPGLKTVSSTFWSSRVLPIISALSSANLSESYDKGILGQRKTLSTACAALLEYVGRGSFGGLPKRNLHDADENYDIEDPVDDANAWEDLVQQTVYEDAVDDIIDRIKATDKLGDHSRRVQAAHRYIILNLASILHYTFVMSPKGPSLLMLLDGVHKLIPYTLIRSTLKIGNAASMINAMVRVVLAKASVGAVTNWLGMSHGADEGMNLLQIIISTVLGWDISNLKKRASQIEKIKDAPSAEQLSTLREYVHKDREEQERCRTQSKTESRSIVSVILSDTSIAPSTHSIALEYLSIQLSVADRQRLIDVICRHNPDLLTPILRDLVTAYEPIIRAIHNAVDLSGTIYDAQVFIDDFIKLSKAGKDNQPNVSDYVSLLKKHQGSTHRFLHQIAKNGKEITEEYRVYMLAVASHFRQLSQENASHTQRQQISKSLEGLVDSLSQEEQETVIHEIDNYGAYLSVLYLSSSERSAAILSHEQSKSAHVQSIGPGAYIERWQSLLNETEITPAEPEGPVRSGSSDDVKRAGRIDVDGEKKGDEQMEEEAEQQMREAPDVSKTKQLLGPNFYDLLKMWQDEEM